MTPIVGLVPEGSVKRAFNKLIFTSTFRFLTHVVSGVITFHNIENRPGNDGICVANHTSVIDVAFLACQNSFSLVSTNIEDD